MRTEIKTLVITVKISERWVPQFKSMLRMMQHLSVIGSSRFVGIYADGDSDFRFESDVNEHDQAEPVEATEYALKDGVFYDAG